MKRFVAVLAAPFLLVTPSRAQWWFSGQAGVSAWRDNVALDVPYGHVSCHSRSVACVDGAVGISWGIGHVYDLAEADVLLDLPAGRKVFVAPRVGVSTVTINDRTNLNGFNASIALWRRTASDHTVRVDAVYRHFPGYKWYSFDVGVQGPLKDEGT
ncbi:MAG TPA: hypothetical protein VGV12_07690 [Gemmatimonadales bacterium]|nr:hypothetical protein [Gemmatimonadales bacterium]